MSSLIAREASLLACHLRPSQTQNTGAPARSGPTRRRGSRGYLPAERPAAGRPTRHMPVAGYSLTILI